MARIRVGERSANCQSNERLDFPTRPSCRISFKQSRRGNFKSGAILHRQAPTIRRIMADSIIRKPTTQYRDFRPKRNHRFY